MPPTTDEIKTSGATMPLRAMLAAIGIGLLASACTTAAPDRPYDVGNMAYPQPLPEGNLSTTTVAGRGPRDTGNMAYPEPLTAGVVGRSTVARQGFDTGNMAYPTPLPAGNGPNTRVR